MTDTVVVAMIVAVPPTLTALAGAILGIINRQKIHEVHGEINSRMEELLALAKKSSHAEGVIEGKQLAGRSNDVESRAQMM